MAPYKNSYSLSRPRAIDGALEQPKPAVATMANWLEMKEDLDPVAYSVMMSLPDA